LLLVLLVPFAMRGFWRGFCREGFGLAGLVVGVLLAAAATAPLSAALVARDLAAPPLARALAFATVLLGVVVVANVIGALADRLARALLLGGLNRAAGMVIGSLKGGAALGFGLVLVKRLVPSPALEQAIAASRLGRLLAALAAGVLEAGRGLTVPSGTPV
jgi:membrane protein required for colicin V production